mgnify:CR=1 FL=1
MTTEDIRKIQRRWMRHCPYGRRGLNRALESMEDGARAALASCEGGLARGLRVGSVALRNCRRGVVVPYLVYDRRRRRLLAPPGLQPPAEVERILQGAMRRCAEHPDITCGGLHGLIGGGRLGRELSRRGRSLKHYWESMLPGTIYCKARIFAFTMLRYGLVEDLLHLDGARVLDAGCGAGYGARYLARRARRVTAVETDDLTLEYARRYFDADNIDWVRGDVTALVTPEEGYDVVVAMELLEHLEDPAGLLRRARDMLAPGGAVVLSTPDAESRRGDGRSNPYHVHEYTRAELKQLIEPWFTRPAIYTIRKGGADGRGAGPQSHLAVAQKATEAVCSDATQHTDSKCGERNRA